MFAFGNATGGSFFSSPLPFLPSPFYFVCFVLLFLLLLVVVVVKVKVKALTENGWDMTNRAGQGQGGGCEQNRRGLVDLLGIFIYFIW